MSSGCTRLCTARLPRNLIEDEDACSSVPGCKVNFLILGVQINFPAEVVVVQGIIRWKMEICQDHETLFQARGLSASTSFKDCHLKELVELNSAELL